MARRFPRKAFPDEERPTSGPVSLTSFIKPQPSRKNNNPNKGWRPLQFSDIGGHESKSENMESDHDDVSPLTTNFNKQLEPGPSYPDSSQPRASLFDLPPLQTNLKTSPRSQQLDTSTKHDSSADPPTNLPRERKDNSSPGTTRYTGAADTARVFGKQLPDPIRLKEEIGTVDGQVIFIAHPNRDVSAHQWSSSSFQWISIGVYSQNRSKIEGSLASDRLIGSGYSQNTLEYFKAVAEQRERNVRENGRQEEPQLPDPSNVQHIEALRRPIPADADHFLSLSNAPAGSPAGALPSFNQIAPRSVSGVPSAKPPPQRTVARDFLEDPFVAPEKVQQPAIPAALNFSNYTIRNAMGTDNTSMGNMNFEYQFPARPTASHALTHMSLTEAQAEVFRERERERLRLLRARPQDHVSPAGLREVEFGEEAMSEFEISTRRSTFTRPPAPLSPEDARGRQELRERLARLGEQARHPIPPIDSRVAVPDVPALRAPSRAAFRAPPGLTVANPTRIVSTLNANAPPYTHITMQSRSHADHPDSDSDETAVNPVPAATLKFSDPDGMRNPASHSIAIRSGNGPMPQNFHGPFFTGSMPTNGDLTAPLASQIDEDEKLRVWFRDGHRSARLEEYCRSLLSTADASTRIRNQQNFGVIGSGSSRGKDADKYSNTLTFVRLWDNVRRYVDKDKTHPDGATDYFTRYWKLAPPSMCDPGPDRNQSFFGESQSTLAQPTAAARNAQQFGGTNWGGFNLGIFMPSKRGPGQSSVVDGRFRGPDAGRF